MKMALFALFFLLCHPVLFSSSIPIDIQPKTQEIVKKEGLEEDNNPFASAVVWQEKEPNLLYRFKEGAPLIEAKDKEFEVATKITDELLLKGVTAKDENGQDITKNLFVKKTQYPLCCGRRIFLHVWCERCQWKRSREDDSGVYRCTGDHSSFQSGRGYCRLYFWCRCNSCYYRWCNLSSRKKKTGYSRLNLSFIEKTSSTMQSSFLLFLKKYNFLHYIHFNLYLSKR